MVEIKTTDVFSRWLGRLRDPQGKAAILRRVERMRRGLAGDVKSVGDGVKEMRIASGPGYRVYYVERAGEIVVLLCAGNKSTQQADIDRAKALAIEV